MNALGASDIALGETLVVSGEEHRFLVLDQLRELVDVKATLLLEPGPRNTAPALTLAALRAIEGGDDPVLVVTPADQTIQNSSAFTDALQRSVRAAAGGAIVILGITPSRPETGYGYIKRRYAPDAFGAYDVEAFTEKPDLESAVGYLASGDYAWNGGIFAFRAGFFLDELQRHRPEIAAAVRAAVDGGHSAEHQFHPDAKAFAAVASESVDYAVMENTDRAAMVPADMGWSDIGNWEALHAARSRDASGNHVSGPAELVDCRNVLVDTDGPRVNVIGLENVMIVVDNGEILVTTAAGAQKVGKLHGALNQ